MNHWKPAYALDASVLIELLAGSRVVRNLVESIARGDVEAYTSRLSLTEALYVACRLWGRDTALQRMRILLDSNTLTIIEDEEIWSQAADCKCRIPISLGDCFTFATAKRYNLTPLFLRPEKEILDNKSKIKEWLKRLPDYVIKS
ncbi:MAG: PIN domain-containing protein [Desulfurococcales archaeon]|nr:PIN domain-containing protein [Desulfurococcales archaeon]